MRYVVATITCFVISTSIYAEICPSVSELQSNKAIRWKAFDSDNGKPLTAAREARLKNQIKNFALAEWSNTTAKGSIHCYYKNESGSHLEAYFAKENISSLRPSKYWYEVTGMMQCAAGADKCAFQVLPEMRQQLARND